MSNGTFTRSRVTIVGTAVGRILDEIPAIEAAKVLDEGASPQLAKRNAFFDTDSHVFTLGSLETAIVPGVIELPDDLTHISFRSGNDAWLSHLTKDEFESWTRAVANTAWQLTHEFRHQIFTSQESRRGFLDPCNWWDYDNFENYMRELLALESEATEFSARIAQRYILSSLAEPDARHRVTRSMRLRVWLAAVKRLIGYRPIANDDWSFDQAIIRDFARELATIGGLSSDDHWAGNSTNVDKSTRERIRHHELNTGTSPPSFFRWFMSLYRLKDVFGGRNVREICGSSHSETFSRWSFQGPT